MVLRIRMCSRCDANKAQCAMHKKDGQHIILIHRTAQHLKNRTILHKEDTLFKEERTGSPTSFFYQVNVSVQLAKIWVT
jgi:hypothetical protein